jgi:signal-transduction protein with cAMP-binding, CBS, and nucleotidyltransferase domain
MRAVALLIQQSISKICENGNGYRKEPTMTKTIGVGTTLPIPYEEAIQRVKEALKAEGKGSRVEVADPQAMLGIVGNEELNAVADEAKRRLQRVVALLGGQV